MVKTKANVINIITIKCNINLGIIELNWAPIAPPSRTLGKKIKTMLKSIMGFSLNTGCFLNRSIILSAIFDPNKHGYV